MFAARTMLGLAVLLTAGGAARAQLRAQVGDWPAWMGADRTGVSHEKGLLKSWPEGGPKHLWKVHDVGEGYSTPSVAGGVLYLMSNTRGLDEEYVLALRVKDGKRLWSTPVGKVGNPRQWPEYPGSRSTPTVDGDAVYVLGSDGDLACLGADKGEVRWKKNLRSEFGGRPGVWAYSESPLIDGDVLVCTPGGDRATLAALNKKDGKVLWEAKVPAGAGGGGRMRMPGNTAAYASPIVATVGGVKMYVQFLTKGLVGVAAKDGKLLWQYERIRGTTNCTTPLFHDGCVFVSAIDRQGNGSGSALVRLTAEDGGVTAREVNVNRELANHHGGVVLVGGYVYGTNNTGLVCVDFKSGETKWQDRSVGKGSVAAADGMLYVRSEGRAGAVALVEATPEGYKEKGRFEQPDRSARPSYPHPVIAGGRLYLRDQDVLLCYDVKAK